MDVGWFAVWAVSAEFYGYRQGVEAPWGTVSVERAVLFVVHNVAALNRLLDVFGVFAGDFRVQFWVTSELDDPFSDGLLEEVAALGLPSVPWEQATSTTFDLVVSASLHGDLGALRGPLVVLPHGIGHSKFAPGTTNSIFGVSREWLVRDGRLLAHALVYSHTEQLEKVTRHTPEAVGSVVVAGDPCFDRMRVSLGGRERYRAALGVAPEQRLVTVTSTWGGGSLLGAWPALVEQLAEELPTARYRISLVVHPNVWYWHGPYQLRVWLARALDRGVTLIPAVEGWRAAIVAADLVVGDHGSVTSYGAGLGIDTVLAAFPADRVVPGTAVHQLGVDAHRLVRDKPLRAQIDQAHPAPDIAGLITSVPGQARRLLRRLFYSTMKLSEPTTPTAPDPVP